MLIALVNFMYLCHSHFLRLIKKAHVGNYCLKKKLFNYFYLEINQNYSKI